jgi:hypothetical protein
MITLADRVKETTTTTGTGTLNLAGAETGFQTFVAGAGNGAEVVYCITDGTDWEVGVGTVTDAAPDTLSRDSVIASSNSGNKVNWGAGSKDVFLTTTGAGVVHWAETFEPSADATLDIDISGCEMVEIVGWLKPATDQETLYLRASNDGGATFEDGAAYYAYAALQRRSDSSTVNWDNASIARILVMNNVGSAAGEFCSFRITVKNPSDGDVKTTFAIQSDGLLEDTGTKFSFWTGNGMVNTAEVNDAVRLFFATGNIADGRVTVYRYPAP